jgi:hypothetical protein
MRVDAVGHSGAVPAYLFQKSAALFLRVDHKDGNVFSNVVVCENFFVVLFQLAHDVVVDLIGQAEFIYEFCSDEKDVGGIGYFAFKQYLSHNVFDELRIYTFTPKIKMPGKLMLLNIAGMFDKWQGFLYL